MKQYWLVLHHNTFLWVKNEEGYIYNSDNYQHSRFHYTNLLKPIIKTLLQEKSLYRAMLSEQQLAEEEIQKWIESIIHIGSAKLVCDSDETHPVSLKPILKMKETVKYYQYYHEKNKDVGIMNNLHKLIIHINGSEYGNSTYAKQSIYPFSEPNQIDSFTLVNFINSFGNIFFLANISLVGCIWEYQYYDHLYLFLKKKKIPLSIYCIEKDIIKYSDRVTELLKEKKSLHITISDYKTINEYIYNLHINKYIYYDFLVADNTEYLKVLELIEIYHLTQANIRPIYTGNNLSFFERLVYTTEDSIQDFHITKQNIFAHQTLNTNFFGILTILSDGNVFSDLNQSLIGTINETLYTIVFREMSEGNAWLRVRDQVPCCNCIFQYLCPSPSCYEKIIGKENLCHIKI